MLKTAQNSMQSSRAEGFGTALTPKVHLSHAPKWGGTRPVKPLAPLSGLMLRGFFESTFGHGLGPGEVRIAPRREREEVEKPFSPRTWLAPHARCTPGQDLGLPSDSVNSP